MPNTPKRKHFMYSGKERRNPPPRFETVEVTREGEKREAVDLALERGTKVIARGKGFLENIGLGGCHIIGVQFPAATLFLSDDHVAITVTSAGKLEGFAAHGDIQGRSQDGTEVHLRFFSGGVDDDSRRIFLRWRGHDANARSPIGKKIFKDRRRRSR